MSVSASGGPAHARPGFHTIAIGGMPGRRITLITAGAALLAAVLAVLRDRAGQRGGWVSGPRRSQKISGEA